MYAFSVISLLTFLVSSSQQQQQQFVDPTTGECTVVNNYNYYGPSVDDNDCKCLQCPSGEAGRPADYPRTCSNVPTKESGYYWISPSPGVLQPIHVYCNFTKEKSITIIGHNGLDEKKVTKCPDAGCYNFGIKYSGSMEQVVAVIAASTHCRQFIKYRCRRSVLLYYPNNVPYGWWVSRSGGKMLYWGGATSGREFYCACGETGTCHDTSKRCNCDYNTGPELSDEGYLEFKDALPVTKLVFGDTDAADEDGWHTLGPLECW